MEKATAEDREMDDRGRSRARGPSHHDFSASAEAVSAREISRSEIYPGRESRTRERLNRTARAAKLASGYSMEIARRLVIYPRDRWQDLLSSHRPRDCCWDEEALLFCLFLSLSLFLARLSTYSLRAHVFHALLFKVNGALYSLREKS